MKRLFIVAFAAFAFLASCKQNKDLTNANAVAAEPIEETSTFRISEPTAPTQGSNSQTSGSYNTNTYTPTNSGTNNATTYTPPQKYTTPVRTQSEDFTFASDSDASKYNGNSYFIIVGSFSSIDNANRFKGELTPKGFSPVVLRSENGYYRVCINSYNNEQAARTRIDQVRNQYPEYVDCWLLIKK